MLELARCVALMLYMIHILIPRVPTVTCSYTTGQGRECSGGGEGKVQIFEECNLKNGGC